ncbi:MAG: polyprenol monophosphomannose synthase [Deltaproteobacteria bacterium]|nr:polyprenol monophosphomannose synthase [Deltaproteobacteria bacterium]
MGTGPSMLVITPTYNERENLRTFLDQLFAAVPDTHVLVVDDNSPDGTGDLAEGCAKEDPRIHVMRRPGKMGLATAYLDAFRYALEHDYERVFQMDTDLSHSPAYLPAFLERLDNGADVVLGSRNIPGGGVEGWGMARTFLSRGGSVYARTILGIGIRDLTGGYKGFRRNVLEAIDLDQVRSEGYSFQIEMTFRALRLGFRIEEVPILFVDRMAGASKMSRRIFAEAVVMVPKLRIDAWRGKL